jgi:hypothetical protein
MCVYVKWKGMLVLYVKKLHRVAVIVLFVKKQQYM